MSKEGTQEQKIPQQSKPEQGIKIEKEEVSGEDQSKISLSQRYPTEKFNHLYPSETIIELSKLQKAIFEIVRVNPNPQFAEVYDLGKVEIDNPNGKSVWKQKLGLTSVALNNLAAAASIVPVPKGTCRLYTPDRNEICYQAAARMTKIDGKPMWSVKTKTIDIKMLEEEISAQMEKKAHDGKLKVKEWDRQTNKYVEKYLAYGSAECTLELSYQTKMAIIQAKKFVREKAESGAFSRCVRHLLGLKSWYTEDQLRKPFVIVRIVRNDDFLLSDPEGKRLLIQEAINSSSNIFGSPEPMPRQLTAPSPEEQEEVRQIEDEDPDERDVHEVVAEIVHLANIELEEKKKDEPTLFKQWEQD